jgi:hypothetical protein
LAFLDHFHTYNLIINLITSLLLFKISSFIHILHQQTAQDSSFEKRFPNPTTQFFNAKNDDHWHPPGKYGENTHPMVASSGIWGIPRPALSSNMLVITAAHCYGHQNGLQRRCICSSMAPLSFD